MIKLLVGALLALSASNVIAGNMYIYKDKENQVLLTNVNPSGNLEAPIKKSKTTVTFANTINNNQSLLGFKIPNGYRLPTKSDNFDDWKRFNGPNHLKADFNGDGIEDEAYLLPKKGSKLGYGVFVSLNKSKAAIQSGRDFQMFKLIGSDDMRPQSFAIELAEPSDEIWKSACGKGYWECKTGEPSAFKINQPSIMFCYIESACTMYMWDSKKLTFKEIQFSD